MDIQKHGAPRLTIDSLTASDAIFAGRRREVPAKLRELPQCRSDPYVACVHDVAAQDGESQGASLVLPLPFDVDQGPVLPRHHHTPRSTGGESLP